MQGGETILFVVVLTASVKALEALENNGLVSPPTLYQLLESTSD